MIYLIGGAPRCGKTTFGMMLAKKKRIAGISSDLIASIVKPYLTKANMLSTGNALTESPKVLLREEIRNAKILWPGTKRLILSLLKWNHDYIIEGVHLLPQYLHELETMPEWRVMKNRVRIVYLVKKDEQKIIDGLKKGKKESDWLLQCIHSERDWHGAANMIREKGLYIEKQAKKYGYLVMNTGDDFTKSLRKLVKELA